MWWRQQVSPSELLRWIRLGRAAPRSLPHRRSKIAPRADKTAPYRDRLADIAGDGNAYQIAAVDRPVRRVVRGPACARKVDPIHFFETCRSEIERAGGNQGCIRGQDWPVFDQRPGPTFWRVDLLAQLTRAIGRLCCIRDPGHTRMICLHRRPQPGLCNFDQAKIRAEAAFRRHLDQRSPQHRGALTGWPTNHGICLSVQFCTDAAAPPRANFRNKATSDAEGRSADDLLLSVEAAVDDFAKKLWMSLGV
jgi:hypothetical protein